MLQFTDAEALMPRLATYGRTWLDPEKKILRFDWTNSGVEIDFEGEYLSAVLFADHGDELLAPPTVPDPPTRDTWPVVGVFLDDMEQPIRRFPVSGPMETWLLIRSFPQKQRHHLRIIKLTENLKTYVGLYGLHYDGEIHECVKKKREIIEFVGDSITCGYGNRSDERDRGFWSDEEDGWNAHCAVAAAKLGMEVRTIGISGITVGKHEHFPMPYAMKDIYLYTDRPGQEKAGLQAEKWDFSREPPRCIVLNLGTNDTAAACFAPDFDADVLQFRSEYKSLLADIRRANPAGIPIVCALGSMNYYLYPEICEAVEEFRKETGDDRVYLFRYRPMAPLDGFGASGHPSMATQKKMGEEIAAFVRGIL